MERNDAQRQSAPAERPVPAGEAGLEPERHYVHHSYIWLGSLRALGAVLVAMAFASLGSIASMLSAFSSADSSERTVAIASAVGIVVCILVLGAIVIGSHVWGYRHLYYTFGEGEFSLYSGIFSKKRMHIPYQRVQSVNHTASVLQRLVGVCTVKVETAGGAANEGATVPYVTVGDAESLRLELFARKQAVLAGRPIPANVSVAGMMARARQADAVSAGAAAAGDRQPAIAGVRGASVRQPAGAPATGDRPSANVAGDRLSANAAPTAGAQLSANAAPTAGARISQAWPSSPVAPHAPHVPQSSDIAAAFDGAFEPDGARNVLDGADELLQDVRGIWGGMAIDTGRVTYEHGLSNRELVLTGLTNNTGFALVAIGVVGTIAQVASGVLELFGDRSEEVANAALSAGANLSPAVIAFGIGAFLLVVVVLWALSAVGACLTYGGFRARRRDNRIEVEHGLLSRKFHGVDVDRVQSVIIRQGFIRRLMGYCEVSLGKVDSASQSSDDADASSLRTGLVVHPFVKLDRVPEILAGLVPEFADAPTDSRPVAPPALRRALVRRCTWAGSGFWLIVLAAVCQVSLHLALGIPDVAAEIGPLTGFADPTFALVYVVGVLWAVAEGIGAVLWFRESSFAFNRHFMVVTNGGYSRESVLLPRGKIQFGMVRSNPFQRAAHVATLSVTTAAGLGTTLRLLDVREEDADAWLSWLRPGGNR